MRKQTKIAAVVSAAALLALGASMTSFAATGWQEENGTWVYYDRSGNQVTNTWAKSGDNWFYLNDNGEMAVDTLIEDDTSGLLLTIRMQVMMLISQTLGGIISDQTVRHIRQLQQEEYLLRQSMVRSIHSMKMVRCSTVG